MVTVIRASSLSNYTDCPRRSAAQLFRREVTGAGFKLNWTPRSVGAVIGTSTHVAAAQMNREHAKSGSLPPRSVALDMAHYELKKQFADGEVAYDGPKGATHSMKDAIHQVSSLVTTYHAKVAPNIESILVEERLTAEVEPGLVLSGQPDQVAREPGGIDDLKTGVMAPRSFTAQLGAYSLLARSHGYDIETARITFLQRVRPDKPQPDPIEKEAVVASAETAAVNIVRMIARDIDVFRNGDDERRIMPGDPWAFAANPSSNLCSPRWCPAFGTEFCHEGDPAKLEVKDG